MLQAHLKATGRQPEPLESLSLVMGELSVCMDEPAPKSQPCVPADIPSTRAPPGEKLAALAPVAEPRTPSPRLLVASYSSPESDGHSDTTSSSWPTLASISPPQPRSQALHPNSGVDRAGLAATGKREVAECADSPDGDTFEELEAPSFMDFAFLDEV